MRKTLGLAAVLLCLGSAIAAAQDDNGLELITFEEMPMLGTTAAGQDILLGGFSGLFFEGTNPDNGNLVFITHTDRGPNAEPVDTDGDGVNERPFPLPAFQPEVIRFEVDRENGTAAITERIGLTYADGAPFTGLSNLDGEPGMAYSDEVPIDLYGTVLAYDPYGADLEGIVRADDGSYWMVDEYRPAIYHVDANFQLIQRYVPEGSSATVDTGVEALPAIFAQRRANRGFEAVAYADGKIYAFIQSPIDNPDVGNDASSKAGIATRILEFDVATETAIGEYLYLLDPRGSDKIGDAVALGNGEFLVMERDDATGTEAIKNVFRINLEGATNLLDLADDVVVESLVTPEDLEAAGIVPVTKTLAVDLATIGYNMVDKPEGLALIDENTIAVINDNDFQMSGVFDVETGLMEENASPFPIVLGIMPLNSAE